MRGRRGRRAVVGLVVLAIALTAWGVTPATGQVPGSLTAECPPILPLDEVTTGMRGTALSVVRGRTPSVFSADVLGILRDAVGPGRDIIITDLSGPAVTEAGGLWAGASGSPVFVRTDGDDRLIGAIAYGLAGGGSTLAGLTPAQDMERVLDLAGPAPRVIKVPTRLARRMAEAAGLSVAETATMTRLRTPLSASGLTDRGLRRMQAAIDRQGLPFITYLGSSASRNPPPPPPSGALGAGDSFAAAMSVGDVTVAGIGTTTFVCDGEAVAFGHPFNWTGDTRMSIHAADTITIVQDPIFGGYKLANIAESVGTLTQDRLAGIAGILGVLPEGAPVTSTVTDLDLGATRSGESEAIFPDFLPFLSFSHLLQNVDVTIDRLGPGSSSIAYTIRGTRDGGASWELTRSTRYASDFDISFESVIEPAFTAEVLQAFDGEDVEVTSMDVPRLDVTETFEQYTIRRVLVWNGTRYAEEDVVEGRPGQRIRLRAILKPVHESGTEAVDLSVRIPDNARRDGYVEVLGGGSIGAEIPCFIVDEECVDDTEQTFDQLLRAFENQPAGDALVARLRLGEAGRLRAQASVRQDAVVKGAEFIGFLNLG